MADVFISYSQGAPEPTHALAAELVQHGIDAWFDVNLLPGDAFAKVIDGEIDRAPAADPTHRRGARSVLGLRLRLDPTYGWVPPLCVPACSSQ